MLMYVFWLEKWNLDTNVSSSTVSTVCADNVTVLGHLQAAKLPGLDPS